MYVCECSFLLFLTLLGKYVLKTFNIRWLLGMKYFTVNQRQLCGDVDKSFANQSKKERNSTYLNLVVKLVWIIV